MSTLSESEKPYGQRFEVSFGREPTSSELPTATCLEKREFWSWANKSWVGRVFLTRKSYTVNRKVQKYLEPVQVTPGWFHLHLRTPP